MAAKVLNGTTPNAPTSPSDETVGLNNFRFNHHLTFHTKTCFKKGEEGRCKLNDVPEPKTRVIYSENQCELFDWNGEPCSKINVTVRPKRLPQDAYTNTHCKAISSCKAPSNSNVSVTTGARAATYTSCYTAKGTQKEDSGELKRMVSYVGSRFLEQRNENTLFEGLSRLMGSVIVGTCEHVVSAPMAAYLVRNQSRFRFSVKFKYIPVREAIDIITKRSTRDTVKMSVMGHSEGCFLTSEALNFIHRPSKDFEDCCLVNFFQDYEVVRSNNADEPNEAGGGVPH